MKDIVAKYGPGGFRTERSLYVKVADAKNLGEERDVYATILVDGIHRARTPTVFKSSAPLFSQEYDMDLENEAEVLTIQLKPHVTKKKEGEFLGCVNIRVAELISGAVVEKWFPLSSQENYFASAAVASSAAISPAPSGLNIASGSSSSAPEGSMVSGGSSSSSINVTTAANASDSSIVGEIRIAIQYSSVTVLADDSYDNLFRLLLKEKMAATVMLSQASAKKEKVVADCLVKAFEARKTGAHYIKTIVQAEIEATPSPNIIFRGNTVATKSVDSYMRLVGQPYLNSVLGPIIQEIYQGRKSCEVDVQRLTKERAPEKVVEKNLQNLLSFCKRIFEAIASSFNRCPAAFRNIFEYIQESVMKRFPGDDVIRYTAPGGFIFLRFFCPALLGPKLFSLAADHPPENIARDLTLIAKTIQNLANLVPFGQKEPYMEGVNSFIADYTPQMKAFLDTLCSPPKEAIDEISSKVALNFGKEVARIHAHLSSSLPTITDNVHIKGDLPESVAILEEINSVLAKLNEELANFPSALASQTAAAAAAAAALASASNLQIPGGRGSSPAPSPATARAGSGVMSGQGVGGGSHGSLGSLGSHVSLGSHGSMSHGSGSSPSLVANAHSSPSLSSPGAPGGGSSTNSSANPSPSASFSSTGHALGQGVHSSSLPSNQHIPSLGPLPEESAAAQTEAMLLRRKLHHIQFIQEQQTKLLQLEKALSVASNSSPTSPTHPNGS